MCECFQTCLDYSELYLVHPKLQFRWTKQTVTVSLCVCMCIFVCRSVVADVLPQLKLTRRCETGFSLRTSLYARNLRPLRCRVPIEPKVQVGPFPSVPGVSRAPPTPVGRGVAELRPRTLCLVGGEGRFRSATAPPYRVAPREPWSAESLMRVDHKPPAR